MSNSDDLYEDCFHMVILRKKFLNLVDRNLCAASILDRFNAMIATEMEQFWYDIQYKKRPFTSTVEVSIYYVAHLQCGIFTEEDVINALNLLIEKGYISVRKKEGDVYTLYVNTDKIDIDTGRTSPQTITATIPQPQTEEILPAQQEETASAKRTYRRNESKRVEYHNNRASRVGLPATLTVAQWTETLEYFNHKCALCPDGAYEVLEHFVPIIHGGGTTEYNCIPACSQCNRIKHDQHPLMLPETCKLIESIKIVQQYLETRRSEELAS